MTTLEKVRMVTGEMEAHIEKETGVKVKITLYTAHHFSLYTPTRDDLAAARALVDLAATFDSEAGDDTIGHCAYYSY